MALHRHIVQDHVYYYSVELSQRSPCIDTLHRPIMATIRYTQALQSLFLSAVPPYTAQCLHSSSVLYRYVVYVIKYINKIF